MKSEMHGSIEAWLMKSGYALELRVAAACRRHSLPTYASSPYQDPTEPDTTRETDVVVIFDRRLSNSHDTCIVMAVIECKFPKGKPWVAMLRPDETVSGLTLAESHSASEDSLDRLTYAWAGFAPFAKAPYADSLVTAHLSQGRTDHNDAGSALRQAMSAASGVQQQYQPPPTGGSLTILLPVLVTAGELVGATLNSTGDIEVEDVSHVFVGTPRPGGHSMGEVHVMTVDYFVESFAPGLDQARRSPIL